MGCSYCIIPWRSWCIEVTVSFKFVFTANSTVSPSSKEDLSDDKTIDVTVGEGGGVTELPPSSEEHENKKILERMAIKWVRFKDFINYFYILKISS